MAAIIAEHVSCHCKTCCIQLTVESVLLWRKMIYDVSVRQNLAAALSSVEINYPDHPDDHQCSPWGVVLKFGVGDALFLIVLVVDVTVVLYPTCLKDPPPV